MSPARLIVAAPAILLCKRRCSLGVCRGNTGKEGYKSCSMGCQLVQCMAEGKVLDNRCGSLTLLGSHIIIWTIRRLALVCFHIKSS
jgi:hypothetical protein